jgi:uncharacterized protein with FMN-binding domain
MAKKQITVAIISVALVAFGLGEVFAGMYSSGTYTGEAMGRKSKSHSGAVAVEVTVSDTAIENIKLTQYEQSVDHEKYGPPATAASEEVPAAIIGKQSLDVDAVSKATVSSNGIRLAVARALFQAAVPEYKAGTYKAQELGRKSKKHSGLVEVEVTVSETKIEDIKIVTYEQSVDHKKYGPPALEAKESVPAAIVAGQTLDVDSVSGATVSSNAIMLATAKAIEQARVKE